MAKQRFSDFSGGITDFRFNTASNYAETMKNWTVLRDKSMQVRFGFEFWDLVAPRIPTNTRVSNVADINDTLVFYSNGKAYYNNTGFQEILGPTGNQALHNSTSDAMVDIAQFGDQFICVDDDHSFPVKMFKDENGILKVVNAGLPQIVSEPVITPSSDSGGSFLYAFVYEYSYKVGTTSFLDLGEPLLAAVTNAQDSFSGTASISAYLELINGVNRNYDTAAIRKRIYRTQNNGTTFYLVDTIDNDVLIYTDSTNDDDLTNGEVLYTQGGVKANAQPPQAKYVAVNDNVVYYANIIEGAENKPFRLRFSKVGDPDSVPESFFEDFDSQITGIAAIDGRTLVFTDKKTIALEGELDTVGRGTIARKSISDINCIAASSIVTTKDYVYWFSDSGIHRTDGVQEEKLTQHLDLSYQALTSTGLDKRRIYGSYDNVNQRVYWCINTGSGDNNSFLVYDEIHKGFIYMDSDEDMAPSSLIYKNQEIIRADNDGYIFKHTQSTFSDLIKSALPVADWWTKAIPYEWKHIAWDMGDSEAVKWVNKINVVGRPKTNVYLDTRIYKEGSQDYFSLSPIKFNPLMIWGDVSLLWGDAANRWNSVDYLNIAKRMHRKAKRITNMQISMASAYATIQGSGASTDSYVQVDEVAKTVSLFDPITYKFGIIYEGYDVIINGFSYVVQSGSESTMLVADPDNTLVDGTYEYEIKGFPKEQRPHISDISIYFELFGDMDKLGKSES